MIDISWITLLHTREYFRHGLASARGSRRTLTRPSYSCMHSLAMECRSTGDRSYSQILTTGKRDFTRCGESKTIFGHHPRITLTPTKSPYLLVVEKYLTPRNIVVFLVAPSHKPICTSMQLSTLNYWHRSLRTKNWSLEHLRSWTRPWSRRSANSSRLKQRDFNNQVSSLRL